KETVNRRRLPAKRFEVNDLAWLSIANYITPRPLYKLVRLTYNQPLIISPYIIELDVPLGIYPRFYINILKQASRDPLPG
ncbi:hypothetical protein ACRALDRAFT_2111713, partial [Sodiomyces alcalophilus JCM 7366]|uniref:uncharacterized protein n=1 Tax=Sodiomyces alcalophilus JCM 7366 TaxID=591952 RepID=UPI0039B5A625